MAVHQEINPLRSSAVEDYTKAIYALQERGEGAVSTNAIAERLGVTAASASGMVKRLGELGLVVHEPAGQPDGDADPVPVGENGDRD